MNKFSRRDFLKATAISVTLPTSSGFTALPISMNSSKKNDRSQQPNILIIMTDQHRWDLMTCAGNNLVPTPNIDRIASQGVRFINAYCPYPVCVASRMSLLTGLYTHHHGADTNEDRLDWRYRTFAHHFSERGYLTGLIGKMHFLDAHNHGFEYYLSINDWLMYLGPKVQHYADEIASHPHNDYFYQTVNDTGAGFPDVHDLWKNLSPWAGNVKRYDFKSMASKLDAEDHLDMFIARESAKFIKRYKEQRFFLVTSFMKPHTPFFPPREWADKYPIEKMKLRPVGDISTYPPHIQKRIKNYLKKDPQLLRAGRAGYLGNLAFVDSCIGCVYDALQEEDLLDNTIVIYTSDHGEMDGQHGLWQKFCLFQPSVSVPLIVSWPKKIAQGKVSEALIEYFGIYPTLIDLVEMEKSGKITNIDFDGAATNMDAKSFAEQIRNPNSEGEAAVFCEYALKSEIPAYMIRTKNFKYHFNHGTLHELYHLEQDPDENVNLINNKKYHKISEIMREQLIDWFDPETNPFLKNKS